MNAAVEAKLLQEKGLPCWCASIEVLDKARSSASFAFMATKKATKKSPTKKAGKKAVTKTAKTTKKAGKKAVTKTAKTTKKAGKKDTGTTIAATVTLTGEPEELKACVEEIVEAAKKVLEKELRKQIKKS